MHINIHLNALLRHEICQKICTAGFSGQKFYTLNFTEFNSFGDKTPKMSENRDIYTTGKNFTLPPAVTAVTNLTSGSSVFQDPCFHTV